MIWTSTPSYCSVPASTVETAVAAGITAAALLLWTVASMSIVLPVLEPSNSLTCPDTVIVSPCAGAAAPRTHRPLHGPLPSWIT